MKAPPENSAAIIHRARDAAASGRTNDARSFYRQAIAAFPSIHELQLELGVMEAQAGDLARARRHLERALKHLPSNPDVHFNLGEVANAEGQHGRAERHFRRTLEIDANFGDAAFGLGKSLVLLKRHEEAIPWLQRATAAAPRDADVLNMLGLALNEARRHVEAIEAFRACLKLDPGRVIAQLNLALALDGAGEPETAHEIICHFEDKNVIPASLWARLAGICYSVKDFKRAWKFAERAIEGGLGVGRATNLKAKLMIDAGEFDAAEALLRANLSTPGRTSAWLNLASINRLDANTENQIWRVARDESLSMEERSTAYFALYHLLKRSADFDRTFEALDMANKLSRHMQPLDVTGDLMLAERVASVFTADFLEGRAGQGFDSPGPIFVLGMPRSGTTLVEQILAAHPTVHPGEERFDMLKLRRSIAGYPMSAAGLSPRWAETAGRQVFNAMFAEAGISLSRPTSFPPTI